MKDDIEVTGVKIHNVTNDDRQVTVTIVQEEIKAEPRKLKSKWRVLTVNGTQLCTKYLLIYWFYKLWWKIRPPEIECYYNADCEKELVEMIVKQIEETKNETSNK